MCMCLLPADPNRPQLFKREIENYPPGRETLKYPSRPEGQHEVV